MTREQLKQKQEEGKKPGFFQRIGNAITGNKSTGNFQSQQLQQLQTSIDSEVANKKLEGDTQTQELETDTTLPEVEKTDKEVAQETEYTLGETSPAFYSGGEATEDARALQEQLIKANYLPEGSADGKWGEGSQAAANQYYRDNNIVPPNAGALDKALDIPGVTVTNYSGLSEEELKDYKGTGKNKQYTINGKPVQYNTSEVSSGGEVAPQLVTFAKDVMPDIAAIAPVTISGGNDAFHLSDQYYVGVRDQYPFAIKERKKQGITEKEYKSWDHDKKLKWSRKHLGKSKHVGGKSMDFNVGGGKNKEKVIASLKEKYGEPTSSGHGDVYTGPGFKILVEDDHFHVEAL